MYMQPVAITAGCSWRRKFCFKLFLGFIGVIGPDNMIVSGARPGTTHVGGNIKSIGDEIEIHLADRCLSMSVLCIQTAELSSLLEPLIYGKNLG